MNTDVGSNTTEVYILNLKDIIFYHTRSLRHWEKLRCDTNHSPVASLPIPSISSWFHFLLFARNLQMLWFFYPLITSSIAPALAHFSSLCTETLSPQSYFQPIYFHRRNTCQLLLSNLSRKFKRMISIDGLPSFLRVSGTLQAPPITKSLITVLQFHTLSL